MSSSSLLPSKYFHKLQVNRLKANDIKSDNVVPTSPSYLFSAVFNNAIFDRNNTGGTLTITKDDTESIIQFSDRPFRQTENINFDTFVSLFDTRGNDSFEEDPPNGVLTHNEEQRTYIIRLLNSNTDSAIFSLELLPGETHNLNTLLGRMNLFVDNKKKNNSIFALAATLTVAGGSIIGTAANELAKGSTSGKSIDDIRDTISDAAKGKSDTAAESRLETIGEEEGEEAAEEEGEGAIEEAAE